jgi:2-oxoisovalerate dehydrogenase E1 component
MIKMMNANLGKQELMQLYQTMMKMRVFEDKVAELYTMGLFHGPVHLYNGEEAVAAGICANLRKDDYILSTHRGHGHCIAKGSSTDKLMAELMGKVSGYNHGRGGSMHIMDFANGNLGTNGIVGAGIPIATGAGLSAKLRGTDQVAVCFFGDGASNQGTFHEGINLAAMWNLPVIFVCENNLYSTWTRQSDIMRIKDIADRAKAYGIPGVAIDGNNVLQVYETGKAAVQSARQGKGPTLIECKTYRHRGHNEGDSPSMYRAKEEFSEWKEKDPIGRLKKHLLETKQFSEEDFRKTDAEIAEEIEEAVRFAKADPYPPIEEATKNVYFVGREPLSGSLEKIVSERELSYREAIREAIIEEMKRDETVFVYGQGFMGIRGGAFTVMKGLQDMFGKERVRDAPISESAMVGCAVGAALTGTKPIVEIQYMDWITLGMDQIVNQMTKMRFLSDGQVKVPAIVRTCFGILSSNGPHHSQSFESWFMHVPGLKVIMPSTPYDAKGLLKAAIRDENPCLYLEHKALYNLRGSVPEEDYVIPLGRADVKREGDNVTIIAIARMVHCAIEAANELEKQGINAEVIDPRTISPFDKQTVVDSVRKTGKVVIVHEACRTGGVAGEITSMIVEEAFDYLDAPIVRVTGLDAPVPYSPPLEKHYLPDKTKIVEAVRKISK